jgi:hypothetical protein
VCGDFRAAWLGQGLDLGDVGISVLLTRLDTERPERMGW